MTLSHILMVGTIIGSFVAAFMANDRLVLMDQRVNATRPRREPLFFWVSVIREYRKLYPESPLPSEVHGWMAASIVLWLLVVLEFMLSNR